MDEVVIFAGDMPSHPCDNTALRFYHLGLSAFIVLKYASTIRKILAAN